MGFFDAVGEFFTGPDKKKKPSRYADLTDKLFNYGFNLEFFHVPSNRSVKFKAFLNVFQDQFNSNWSSTPVYGRMDDIKTFQGTTRTMTLEWDVVAHSRAEADENLKKCSLLVSMLYPTYAEDTPREHGASTIRGAPLFKVKFVNLVAQPGQKGTAATSGLVGSISGLTYAPDMEQGIFKLEKGSMDLAPQMIRLSCEFTVLHTHKLGWVGTEGDVAEPRAGTGARPDLKIKEGAYPYGRSFPAVGRASLPATTTRSSAGSQKAGDKASKKKLEGG